MKENVDLDIEYWTSGSSSHAYVKAMAMHMKDYHMKYGVDAG